MQVDCGLRYDFKMKQHLEKKLLKTNERCNTGC